MTTSNVSKRIDRAGDAHHILCGECLAELPRLKTCYHKCDATSKGKQCA